MNYEYLGFFPYSSAFEQFAFNNGGILLEKKKSCFSFHIRPNQTHLFAILNDEILCMKLKISSKSYYYSNCAFKLLTY